MIIHKANLIHTIPKSDFYPNLKSDQNSNHKSDQVQSDPNLDHKFHTDSDANPKSDHAPNPTINPVHDPLIQISILVPILILNFILIYSSFLILIL